MKIFSDIKVSPNRVCLSNHRESCLQIDEDGPPPTAGWGEVHNTIVTQHSCGAHSI